MRYMVLLLAELASVLALGCGGDKNTPSGSGFIEATDAVVSAEVAGRVTALLVDEGDDVHAGDTLVRIDSSRLELQLASTQATREATVANLQAARLQVDKSREQEKYTRNERDRVSRLLASGSSTQKQLDQLEYEFTQATIARKAAEANVVVIESQIAKSDADIDQLKRQLLDCYPTAPLSGTVVEKYIEDGELLNPGKAIVKIARLDTVWVKVYLNATDFASVKIGDKATVSTESGGTSYDGTVIWTSAEAEFTPKNVQTEKSRSDLVYAVKVRMANTDGRLKIGMPVFVTMVR
ncbi:MAG: efflux RND transporter periplasmic adaptor subunit [Candidatus Zixiibacteriota bacterium]